MKTKTFLMITVGVLAIFNAAFAYNQTGYIVNQMPAGYNVQCSGTCNLTSQGYALQGYQGGQGQSLTLYVTNEDGLVCQLQAQQTGNCMSTRWNTQCNYQLTVSTPASPCVALNQTDNGVLQYGLSTQ